MVSQSESRLLCRYGRKLHCFRALVFIVDKPMSIGDMKFAESPIQSIVECFESGRKNSTILRLNISIVCRYECLPMIN